jgi:hypothetical protein
MTLTTPRSDGTEQSDNHPTATEQIAQHRDDLEALADSSLPCDHIAETLLEAIEE